MLILLFLSSFLLKLFNRVPIVSFISRMMYVIKKVLPCFPNEIRQVNFIHLVILYLSQNLILLFRYLIIHHNCSLVIIWILLLNLLSQVLFEFNYLLFKNKGFFRFQLSGQQLLLLAHLQASFPLNLLDGEMLRNCIGTHFRRAIIRECIKLLA